jgi:hypothetical protein
MTARLIVSAALVALLLGGDVPAKDPARPPLHSGPPVGAKNNRSGFFPQFVTGPCAGQNLCPV